VEARWWYALQVSWLMEEKAAAVAAKLLLFGLSSCCVVAAGWLLLVNPVGSHSPAGWALAAVCGVWKLLVWRPSHRLLVRAVVLDCYMTCHIFQTNT
jgi:hypothetical protein